MTFPAARACYAGAMRIPIALALTLFAAGCGKPDNAPGPGGVTVGEARALDEAAAKIEAQRLPADLVQPAVPGPSAPATGTPAP